MIITLPDIGRGGPGLRKRFLTDQELEQEYRDGSSFLCNKCGKRMEDRAGFRKHLTYHTHREKNYLYKCPNCSNIFCDPSNLKRHIQAIHEKQIFRCLHCDFEDTRKRRLEEHLLQAHGDRAEEQEEQELGKEQEQEVMSPLAGSEESSLPSFTESQTGPRVFTSPKRSSPNILQVCNHF